MGGEPDAAQDVVAMQFAGGASVARLAREWDRDAAWVEEAIRVALLRAIPKRDGGLKEPRAQERRERAEQSEQAQALEGAQGSLSW